MLIETTINIRSECLKKISHAALLSGKSRSEIITLLMKHVMDVRQNQIRFGRRVQYQEKDQAENWHTLHVLLRPDDYEYFLDLRKLLKMSVSLILSVAVDKFLNQIIGIKNTDNYQFKNYVLIKRIINGLIHWTLIWGYPPNIEAYFDHPPENDPQQKVGLTLL